MGQILGLPDEYAEKEDHSSMWKFNASEAQKMRLQRVRKNWRTVVDQVLGLKIKLNDKNLESVFASHLPNRCPNLIIYESAGLIPWNFCPFNETQLQTVDIRGEILVDNWKLLLTTCKRIRTLIIQLQPRPRPDEDDEELKIMISSWNAWTETPGFEIDLNELSILFFKGFMTHCDFHYSTVLNLLKTIKTPKLKQFVCAFWVDDFCCQQPIFPEFLQFQTFIIGLKQNCPELTSFGWVSALSEYGENEFWESLCKRGKNAMIIHGSYSFWKPIANLFLAGNTLEEIHYDFGTFIDAQNSAQIIQDTAALQSENIEIISLGLKKFLASLEIHVEPLQLFSHLRELRIGCNLGLDKEVSMYNQSFFIIVDLKLPATLEKIFISSFPMLHLLKYILDCPNIKEITIRNQTQGLSGTLKKDTIDKALNHKTLKWMILDLSLQKKIEKFITPSSQYSNDLLGKWMYGVEKRSYFVRMFYCVNTFVTRENILENPLVGTAYASTKRISGGFAMVNCEHVTEQELKDMELLYTF